jgi:hypothetical protein
MMQKFLSSPRSLQCSIHLVLLGLIIPIIFHEGKKYFSLSFCFFLPVTSKYSHQCSLFKHPQGMGFAAFTVVKINIVVLILGFRRDVEFCVISQKSADLNIVVCTVKHPVVS